LLRGRRSRGRSKSWRG
jgi:hypothetical protein